jgi:hypothetical protein
MMEYIKHAIAMTMLWPDRYPRVAFVLLLPVTLAMYAIAFVALFVLTAAKAALELVESLKSLHHMQMAHDLWSFSRDLRRAWYRNAGQYAPVTRWQQQEFRRELWELCVEQPWRRTVKLTPHQKRLVGDVWTP